MCFYKHTYVHIIKHTFTSATHVYTEPAFVGGDIPTELSCEAVNESDLPQSQLPTRKTKLIEQTTHQVVIQILHVSIFNYIR